MSSTGVKKCSRSGWVSKLRYALQYRDVNAVQSLLKDGADVNHVFQELSHSGMAPITIAIAQNSLDIAKLLIAQGCNVDIESRHGETPLFYAIQRGRLKHVELLLKAGCNINHESQKQSRPIYEAIHKGHRRIVKILLDSNVDLNCRNRNGDTPFMLAVRLYCNRYEWLTTLTRRRSPSTIVDIICLLMHHVDLGCEDHKSLLPKLMRLESTQGRQFVNMTVTKELMRHGPVCGNVLIEYSRTSRHSHLQPDILDLLHQAFSFHMFCELRDELTATTAEPRKKLLNPHIREYFNKMTDLQTLCCQIIRCTLSYNRLWWRIDQLNMPAVLKDRLKLKNF